MTSRKLAPYVLQTIARHQLGGRLLTLQTLVDELGVRRTDLRKTVTALHRQGLVDAMRMRLTLTGLVLGTALLRNDLPPLRRPRVAVAAA
jgi:DNA-binding IclR family transcriptional regulator